jgi:RNA polymerase sigma factor (sigma-70 family)
MDQGTRPPAARAPRSESLPAAVLAGLPRRDPAALAAFYDAYFGRIWGYVKRMVHDEHLTEDLTQEILMNVHRALPGYDPARALSPWVFTIATNKLRDHWQSRRFQDARHQVSLDDEDGALLAPPARARAPAAALERRELAQRVAEAVARLPESLRVPFWLRWREELSFADVARQLGTSEVAARKRYSRALAELRKLLVDEADGPGGER